MTVHSTHVEELPVKSTLRLMPLIVLLASVLAFGQDKRTVAILDFNNNSISDKERLEPLRKGLADILITELSQVEAFDVVERDRLRQVVAELEFSRSDVVDPATAQAMGRLLGARNLLFGSFVNSFGERLRVDVRVVEVETGKTLKAFQETGKLDELFDVLQKLNGQIIKYFNVTLTKEDRERRQDRTPPDKFEATLLFSRAIDAEDSARDLERAGKRKESFEMLAKARDLLDQALAISPDFKDAQHMRDTIHKILSEQ